MIAALILDEGNVCGSRWRGVVMSDWDVVGVTKISAKKMCIIRESNTGLIDGNDEFYH